MSMSMVYTKFAADLEEYLKGKLPDLPAHIAQEIAAHIGNKTMILVNDMLKEYIKEQKMDMWRRSQRQAQRSESPRDKLRTDGEKPRAIYLGFSSHDCEARYKCPVCGTLFGSWSIHREENENGTKKCCPDCKTELSWPE